MNYTITQTPRKYIVEESSNGQPCCMWEAPTLTMAILSIKRFRPCHNYKTNPIKFERSK